MHVFSVYYAKKIGSGEGDIIFVHPLILPVMPALSERYLISQGYGNTMPDLSDFVLFHSGQVRNIYLLVQDKY